MGTRRIRALSARPGVLMALFDERGDRCQRAAGRFEIPTFASLEQALAWEPDALVISTPPDRHADYVEVALQLRLAHFVEAGIRVEPAHAIAFRQQDAPLSAPSCTFHFMPVFQRLREILPAAVGRLHSYQMYLSCNLPEWHPDERGRFYAYRPTTNAAREMVPFELYWLNALFGVPASVSAAILRRGSLPTAASDTYLAQFNLENGAAGQLAVAMASPARFRRGVAVGEAGIVAFDILSGVIERLSPDGAVCERLETGSIQEVTEAAYDTESAAYHESLVAGHRWPHSYDDAARITAVLGAMERSVADGGWQTVDSAAQPVFDIV